MEIISALISSVFTLIAGGVAYLIYLHQKREQKRDSAKAIYQEIVYLEKTLKELKKVKQQNFIKVETSKFSLSSDSWDKYKYNFINDLDYNEWDNLNTFFNQCNDCDGSIKSLQNLSPMNIEFRTSSLQFALMGLSTRHADEYFALVNNNSLDDETKKIEIESLAIRYESLRDIIANTYTQQVPTRPNMVYIYSPIKDYNHLEEILNSMEIQLSTSSIGLKLKEIAKL